MFDGHVDYYHAIQRYMIEDPSLARSLSQQWEYQDRINESVVRKLIQASQLCGFTGKLTIGSRIGCDTTLSAGVPLPHWASLIDLTNVTSTSDSLSRTGHGFGGEVATAVEVVDEDDIPREVNVDTELVVQLIERLSTA